MGEECCAVSGTSAHQLYDFGNGAMFTFVQEGWLWPCLPYNAEFSYKKQIVCSTSVCEPNCLQTKAFMGEAPLYFAMFLV